MQMSGAKFLRRLAQYAALVGTMSILFLTVDVAAQQNSAQNLIDALKGLDGGNGALQKRLGVGNGGGGSPLDGLRRGKMDANVPGSPLGTIEQTRDPAEFSKFRFTLAEKLRIYSFCVGQKSATEIFLLSDIRTFSRIERDYCERIREPIYQIGYDIFEGVATPEVLVNGAVQDDYVLGIGDEVVITLRGKNSVTINTWVDREGNVVIPDLDPLRAAGYTYREFRTRLTRSVEESFIGTKAFLSMGAVRLVAVSVTGEVENPGVHQLTGLSTVMDAIALAQGVKKTGSLRQIQVHRGDKLFWIDAYDMFFSSFSGIRHPLMDGDRIVVPVIGDTFAVAGQVKRPGIFEFPEGKSEMTIAEALALSGGGIRPRGHVFSLRTFDNEGREIVSETTDPSATVRSGDVVEVSRREDVTIGSVELAGHVRAPGHRSLASSPTVSALIKDVNAVKVDPYLAFGVLETTDPSTRSRQYFAINLLGILNGTKDFLLRDNDRLFVLSKNDIRYLTSNDVQAIIGPKMDEEQLRSKNRKKDAKEPEDKKSPMDFDALVSSRAGFSAVPVLAPVPEQNGGIENGNTIKNKPDPTLELMTEFSPCAGLKALENVVRYTNSNRFSNAARVSIDHGQRKNSNAQPCPSLFNQQPYLLPFVLEYAVAIQGEVRNPGIYPVAESTSLQSIVSLVGGMTQYADISNVEYSHIGPKQLERQTLDLSKTKIDTFLVNVGDAVRFSRVFSDRESGPILLSGEFRKPGLYQINRGERLSQVIARAGGLTAQAYPYGAVFTRNSVMKIQRAGFARAVREMNTAAMFALGQNSLNAQSILALRELTEDMASVQPMGRVVIDSDPTILQVRPELDSVLQPGDKLFMPKRPNSVIVMGDVLNPGALQFIAGKKADDYINQAGGLQISGDEDKIFLVYPNGVAQPVKISVWNYGSVRIPPGSTIVVPKDVAPLNLFTFAKDITALLSQMAITAASLAVIGNN